jgi:hypothetical protein
MKFYNLNTELTFGKFEGKTVEEVLALQPSYFDFCLLNLDHFFLSDEVIAEMKVKNPNFMISEAANQKRQENYESWQEGKEHDSKHDDGNGMSYEKYGGYNDWSDEVIDDAFDGDPEMTWNVD